MQAVLFRRMVQATHHPWLTCHPVSIVRLSVASAQLSPSDDQLGWKKHAKGLVGKLLRVRQAAAGVIESPQKELLRHFL